MRLAQKNKLVSGFPERLNKVLNSTFLYLSGTCCTVKVGSTKLSAEQLRDNVLAVIAQAVKHVPKHWDGIQSIFLKAAKSAALPVFERNLDKVSAALVTAASAAPEAQTPSGKPAKGGVKRKTAAMAAVKPEKKAKKAASESPAATVASPAVSAAQVLEKIANVTKKARVKA